MNEQLIQHIESLYNQANTHLLEQTNKRDQILLFYFVFISFYVTQSDKINSLPIHSILSILIFLIGIIILSLLIELRSWHLQYVSVAKLATLILSNSDQITDKDSLGVFIENYYDNKKKEKNKSQYKNFFVGLDNKIMMSISIIVGCSSYFMYKQITILNNNLLYSLIIMTTFLTCFLTFFFYNKRIKTAKGYKPWIIQGLIKQQPLILKNKYLTVLKDNESNYIHIEQNTGGVVIVPTCNNKFLLIKIIRNEKENLEFPRGFSENNEDLYVAAKRELKEELNLSGSIESLGHLSTDTGLITDNIEAFHISIEKPNNIILQNEEKIISYIFCSKEELEEKIISEEIIDNFTLSSYLKYKLKNPPK
ncbi:MAG: NUDIX domain-containing protein [Vagococcus sp.]